MVLVKICGVTNWRDAKLAIEAGADFLGFNFYPRSPRYITPARARQIVRRLPRSVRAVGVFVNEDAATIRRISRAVGLQMAQLHGEESPQTVAEIARALPVIKAFRVRRGFRPATLRRYRAARAFLLDGYSPRRRGGAGEQFDWRIVERARRFGKIFLAGGVRPENATDAVLRVRPYALDVCSGVESKPGKKDAARLRELTTQVAAANRKLG